MLLFLILVAAIWWGGRRAGWPAAARGYAIAILYVAVLAVQVALPEGHTLRQWTGGSAGLWLLLGAGLAAAAAYRVLLSRLRARARPVAVQPPAPGAVDPVVERHARHLVLREIGGQGQRALMDAKVLVVGAGGLGSPALLYLAGAGVGTLGVIDDDAVDVSNLHRQVIHRDADIGIPKVASALRAIKALNPHVEVRPYRRRLTEEIAADLIGDYDLVLDGTDDWATRALVNRTCAAQGKPLVWGAITQWEGQLTVFDTARGTPCHNCLFPVAPAPGIAPSCAEGGVAGPLPGMIGAQMAMEAVKHIAGAGETLAGRLQLTDALHAETRVIAVARDPACPVCGAGRGAGRGAGAATGPGA